MGESEPDYESRQAEILQFVSENANCKKADVIRHMIGRSAVTTTHAILKDIIRDGKINVHKKNLQTHLLTINHDNEFIWINNQLYDITKFIERCEKITKKLEVFIDKNLPELRKKKAISERSEQLYVLFLRRFILPINTILHQILIRTNDTIESEKDAQFLNRWIVDLMVRLGEMTLSAPGFENTLNLDKREIKSGIDKLSSDIHVLKRLPSNEKLTLLPEYDKLSNDFKQMAENYMKEYTRTYIAYSDSHEKSD